MPGAIERPKTEQTFEKLTGILRSYQFLVVRDGVVAARSSSCWCAACSAVTHPGEGAMNSICGVAACDHRLQTDAALHEWTENSVAALSVGAVNKRRTRSQVTGRNLARLLKPGEWLLAQAREDPDDTLWLGRTVSCGEHGFNYQCSKETQVTAKLGGVCFAKKDYAIAVQWYNVLAEDAERRTFVEFTPTIDFVNSTELRLTGFDLDLVAGEPRTLRPARQSAAAKLRFDLAEAATEKNRKWRLRAEDENIALASCW
jgi:hypothetical protein